MIPLLLSVRCNALLAENCSHIYFGKYLEECKLFYSGPQGSSFMAIKCQELPKQEFETLQVEIHVVMFQLI